jgi:hypothetical protein
VYLYQYSILPTWSGTPNASPFCVKLEAYLNFAGIKYVSVPTISRHPQTNKLPYIRFNGVTIPDSSLSIEYLNDALKIDLDAHLTLAERGIARAFTKLMEESLYWSMVSSRWVVNGGLVNKLMLGIPAPFSYLIMPLILRDVRANVVAAGMGRLTPAQVNAIGHRDLDALAAQLGDQKFLMGDRPSSVDCAALGALANILWAPFPSAQKEYIQQVSQRACLSAHVCDGGTIVS